MKLNAAFTILISLAPSLATAATLVVEAPCDVTPWLATTVSPAFGQSVGALTITALDREGVPYVGSAGGIASIRNTVSGDQAIGVLSDTEMRAYGWCFSLNGEEPDLMPDDVIVADEHDEIRWYFGFAQYRDGAWISYCTRTSVVRPAYICG